MNRKHFIALAEAIRNIRNPDARHEAANRVADACQPFNPRFDRVRFLTACGV